MNRLAAKAVRRRFLVALGHAIHVTWPVLSAILGIQLALGLLTGFVEGWSLADTIYFTFITGLTIGYGDLVPRWTLTRVLAIGMAFPGSFSRVSSRQLRSMPCVQPSPIEVVALSTMNGRELLCADCRGSES